MMLRRSQIAARLNPLSPGFAEDPFFIVPHPPNIEYQEHQASRRKDKRKARKEDRIEHGAASIDVRLGTWFLVMRQTYVPVLEVTEPTALGRRLQRFATEHRWSRKKLGNLQAALLPKGRDSQIAHYVHTRFGEDFILHPRSFVLGVTLEWIRLPSNLGGYVTGRSSWGRRGLVIATATGVHPGFTGCLTMELTNLGDIPIAIRPGMTIGQLFLHDVHSAENTIAVDHSSFVCNRRPRLGNPNPDVIAQQLSAVEP
ncbi:MAG TPA: dCTP deaminase [Chthoniobacterales bacterium]|nr:dCTP deaminase [Chthoniobacterales bacterium]